jgi:hypothetical protein
VILTPAESVFVAYDIPTDLRNSALRYFKASDVRSMDDDRGRYIVQATQNWHDHFAAMLKATPKWRDPAAAKERAAAPVLKKKVDNEDILQWRNVGLSLKRNPGRRPFPEQPDQPSVVVTEIAPGSPAAWEDMRPGDVLSEIGSFRADSMPEVQSLIKVLGEGLQSKKAVRVKFLRPYPPSVLVADFVLGPEDLAAKPAEPRDSKPRAGAQVAPNPYIPRVTIAAPATPAPVAAKAAPAVPAAAAQPELPAEPSPGPPMTAQDEKRNRPFYLVLFYHPDDPDPRDRFEANFGNLQREYPGQIDGAVINVESDAAAAELRKVKRVPTYILYHNRKEVARLVGEQTTEQLLSAFAKIQKPRDGGPAELVSAADKSALRYEGKTFDAWRTAWQTEISIDKRTEAVRALAAFGSRGYGPEASEAILNVAQEYEQLEYGNTPEGKFGDAVRGSLTVRIPKKDWLPLLRKRYEADPAKWQKLAIQLLPQSHSSSEKENDDIRSMLLMLAQSEIPYISSQAYDALVSRHADNEELSKLLIKLFHDKSHWISAVRWLGWTPQYPPEVIDLMLHGDNKQQADARRTFADTSAKPAKIALVATMIGILKDDSKSADHIAAIRTLAALGSANSGTFDNTEAPQVLKEIVKKGPTERQVAAAFALQQSTRGRTQATDLLAEYARDTEGKSLGRAAAQSLLNKESEAFNGK